MWQLVTEVLESMEVYIGVYEYEFKFELLEGSAGDKLSWNKTQKKQKWNSYREWLSRGTKFSRGGPK